MIILCLLALLPPAALMYVIYQQDKIEKEPAKLLAKIFAFGCLSTIPAIVLEMVGGAILGMFLPTYSVLYIVLENFIVVAMSEEFVKMMGAKLAAWKSPEFNYKFDSIVYCVFSALGFAALENLLYVLPGGFHVGVARSFLSIPGHCIFGIIVGYYFGLAKEAEVRGDKAGAKKLLWKSIIMASLAHGFYDCALSLGSTLMMLLFFVFVVVMDVWAIRFVKKQSKEDTALPIDASVEGQPVAPAYGQPQAAQAPQAAPVFGQPAYVQTGAPVTAPVPEAAPVQSTPFTVPEGAATATETPVASPVDMSSNNSNSFKK